MTVTTTYEPALYTGDGSTTQFSLNHLIYEQSHLSITIDGVITAAWSVTGLGDAGGVTVTFSSAPSNGAAIVIQRIVPYTQNTNLENFDGNPADVTEQQFDLLAMADQQIATQASKAITVPLSATISSNEISGTIDSSTRILTITTSGPAASELANLSSSLDFVLTGLASGDFIQYDGSNWVNLDVVETRTALNIPLNNLAATADPTVNEDSGDGYSAGSLWINTNTNEAYRCLDSTVGAAVWEQSTLTIDDLGNAVTFDVATQGEAEAGASSSTLMTPQRTKQAIDFNVPDQTKAVAWGVFDGTNTGTFAALAGYNIDNIVRNGTGDYSISFTNDMDSANYVVTTASSRDNDGTDLYRCACEPTNLAPTGFKLHTGVFSSAAVTEDHSRVHFVVYGTLA